MVSTLFLHPAIHTLESDASTVSAMLVTDGRIVALGTEENLRAQSPEGTETVQLEGGIVLPGFHDAHFHIGNLARELEAPDLREATSLAETLELLRVWKVEHPGSEWVLGGRWNQNQWTDGETPHRSHLDTVFGDRPVALPSVDGHSVWANSAGLAAVGIDRNMADPVGGRIDRDEAGEPTGWLFESAMDEIRDLSEAALISTLHESLDLAQRELLAVGITHITNFDGDDVRQGMLRLQADGRLRIRAHLGSAAADLDRTIAAGRRTGDGDEWITEGPVKLYSDGALGSHTAFMHEDFVDEPGNHGIAIVPFEELCAQVEQAVSNGIAVATHAIGDRANTNVLDAYERVAALAAEQGLLNRVEHGQHLQWADVERFTKLNVVASLQPIHCTTDFPLSHELIGDRDIAHYPWRSLIDSGALLAFGSDAPVEPANPLFGVHAAVTRENRAGEPAGGREPEQRISLLEALQRFTAAGADAANLGHQVGRLAPGQLADFVVLDRDIFAVDPREIPNLQVRTVVVDGRIVHESR